MFEKLKRIFALLCAVLLAGMYGATLIFALLDSPWAKDCLKASLAMTLVIPVLLYAYIFIYRLLKNQAGTGEKSREERGEKK